MKLQMLKRAAAKKSEAKQIRRAGQIPAVIYHRSKEPQSVAVLNAEFDALVRNVQPGRLSTNIFTLVDDKGHERKAILKEIQYNVTNYNVIHLDFEELHDNVPVNVKVPIECSGIADCPGIKLGGALRQVIRRVRVRCLPKDIPQAFVVDVKSMNLGDVRRIGDLEIPQTIKSLAKPREVAVAIVKR